MEEEDDDEGGRKGEIRVWTEADFGIDGGRIEVFFQKNGHLLTRTGVSHLVKHQTLKKQYFAILESSVLTFSVAGELRNP